MKSHDRNLLANNKAMLRRFPFQHYRNQVFMGQQMIDKDYESGEVMKMMMWWQEL